MFERIIGNPDAKARLARMVAAGRLPNSLILAGSEGIGKRLFAIELARSFTCTNRSGYEPCGRCSACMRSETFVLPKPTDKNKDEFERVIRSGHGDVCTVVNYKNFILVKAIRDLEREANFRPFEASARFFIIDDAHKMNETAANALLKILEEPPSTAFLCLITSRLDSLLPTILSRCQILRFPTIATPSIERYLVEDRAFAPDDAKLASRISNGSIGSALALNVDRFRERRQLMLDVIKNALFRKDLSIAVRAAEELTDAKNKDHFEENLEILGTLARDVWLVRISGVSKRIVNADITDEIVNLSKSPKALDFAKWLAALVKLRSDLAVNINRKAATDSLMVRIATA